MNKPKAHTHLPVGIVTFLFTDIEGSTQLWEQAPEETMQALAQHDEIMGIFAYRPKKVYSSVI